jgi:hypothetical protein
VVEEARAVLAQLERIEELEREAAPAAVVLDEVRSLLTAAEAWVRVERAAAAAAADALEGLREALEDGDLRDLGPSRTLIA